MNKRERETKKKNIVLPDLLFIGHRKAESNLIFIKVEPNYRENLVEDLGMLGVSQCD